MKENILIFDSASPEELTAKLAEAKPPAGQFAALAISGPQVLVRPFELTNVALKDVPNRLRFEAVELLSVSAEKIALDFQVFSSSAGKISGIFLCAPQSLIQDYLKALDSAKLIALKITSRILAGIDTFLKVHQVPDGRFCLLDLSRPRVIGLAIFLDKHCELIREISYEKPDEAIHEVVQSIRSVCAKSQNKVCGQIFYSGTPVAGLNEELERSFEAKVEGKDFSGAKVGLDEANNFFSLNVAREHSFSIEERQQFLTVAHAVLGLVVLCVAMLGGKSVTNDTKLKELKASYKPTEYKYARDLEKQMKAFR